MMAAYHELTDEERRAALRYVEAARRTPPKWRRIHSQIDKAAAAIASLEAPSG